METIGSFTAQGDDDNVYTVYICANRGQDQVAFGQTARGQLDLQRKVLKTEAGDDVQRIGKGIYEIEGIMGNVRLTSDDPNAP